MNLRRAPRHLFARLPRLRAACTVIVAALLLPSTAPASPQTPASTTPTAMQLIHVPARIADLAFSYTRPLDFHPLEIPDEKRDFDNPTTFLPLEMTMANYGVVLFWVAARPAYGDGTVEDWAGYIARENGLAVTSLQPSAVGGLPAILIEATQQEESGLMRVRCALLEDGHRMINISVMAPEAIWASVEPTLQAMLMSFRLDEPRGSQVALTRADAEAAAQEQAAAIVSHDDSTATPPGAPDAPPAAEDAPAPALPAEVALAEDDATLHPEHPVNRRLLEGGAGFALRVLTVHPDEKYAVVGSGALMAGFHLPLGWHALDDGKRVLVFDADGRIQVSINLRQSPGDAQALLESLRQEALDEQPAIDPFFAELSYHLPTLVLRNYRDGDDVLVQAFAIRALRDDGWLHVARITAAPDDVTQALQLTEVILNSLTLEPLAVAR